MSGVSPSGFRVLGSAPALSSASTTRAEPMMAASVIAVVPNWFFSRTLALAAMSARTRSRSSLAAAHMTAVVPSAPGVFGSAPLASSASAAARSPRSAAATSGESAANAIEQAARKVPTARSPARRMSDLRDDAAAVAQFLQRDVVAVEQRHQLVREA